MPKKTERITAASFLISEDCNLACSYCFELKGRSKKKMSKEVARKGLELLCEGAKASKQPFSAMLFGGEPTMAPDIMEEIFRYGLELSKIHNVPFTANMVTNGTILTDEIAAIIKQYGKAVQFSVQLSVDGIKSVHDKYRVTRAGHGSFDLVEKNVAKWKELIPPERLSVHGCINKESLPFLYEGYKFFREEWLIPRTWFMPVHEEAWDAADVELYRSENKKIVDHILHLVRLGHHKEIQNYSPLNRCTRPDVRPNKPCGAGGKFVTITADGDIYPCHHFYFNDPEKETIIGTVFKGVEDVERRMFLDYTSDDLDCPKECEQVHCYRCVAVNWVANGNMLSQIKGFYCQMSKIDREMQLTLREELKKMGLYKEQTRDTRKGNNPANPDCLCDSRGGGVQVEDHKCNCKPTQSIVTESNEQDLAFVLQTVLTKLEKIEEKQNFMIKTLLP